MNLLINWLTLTLDNSKGGFGSDARDSMAETWLAPAPPAAALVQSVEDYCHRLLPHLRPMAGSRLPPLSCPSPKQLSPVRVLLGRVPPWVQRLLLLLLRGNCSPWLKRLDSECCCQRWWCSWSHWIWTTRPGWWSGRGRKRWLWTTWGRPASWVGASSNTPTFCLFLNWKSWTRSFRGGLVSRGGIFRQGLKMMFQLMIHCCCFYSVQWHDEGRTAALFTDRSSAKIINLMKQRKAKDPKLVP